MTIKLLPLSFGPEAMNVEDFLGVILGVVALKLQPINFVVGLIVGLLSLGRIRCRAITRDNTKHLEPGYDTVFEVFVGRNQ